MSEPRLVIVRPMAVNPFRIPGFRDLERLAFEGHISMQELCRRADVHPTTFRHWKSGRSTPSVAIVQALLDVGVAAVEAAERAGQDAASASPGKSWRAAAKPAAKRKARTPAAAKAAAAKRPARRQA
jgi:transcriptional regulator with XRE-family HTH domain